MWNVWNARLENHVRSSYPENLFVVEIRLFDIDKTCGNPRARLHLKRGGAHWKGRRRMDVWCDEGHCKIPWVFCTWGHWHKRRQGFIFFIERCIRVCLHCKLHIRTLNHVIHGWNAEAMAWPSLSTRRNLNLPKIIGIIQPLVSICFYVDF